jgi:hypothetical protein
MESEWRAREEGFRDRRDTWGKVGGGGGEGASREGGSGHSEGDRKIPHLFLQLQRLGRAEHTTCSSLQTLACF